MDALTGSLLAELLAGVPCLFDPELHDGPAGVEEESARVAREAVAVEVCGECPLLAVCERWARSVRPAQGVWAGLTPAARVSLPPADAEEVAA